MVMSALVFVEFEVLKFDTFIAQLVMYKFPGIFPRPGIGRKLNTFLNIDHITICFNV